MLMYTPTLCIYICIYLNVYVSSLWSHLFIPKVPESASEEDTTSNGKLCWNCHLLCQQQWRWNTGWTIKLQKPPCYISPLPDPNHFSLLCPKKITTKTAVPLPKMHHQNPTPINLHLLRSTIIPQMWLWNHHRCTIFCFKVIIQSPNGRHGEGLSGSRHATELIIIVEGLWCFTRLNVDHLKPWIHGQQDPHYPVWVGLLKCHLYIVLALK